MEFYLLIYVSKIVQMYGYIGIKHQVNFNFKSNIYLILQTKICSLIYQIHIKLWFTHSFTYIGIPKATLCYTVSIYLPNKPNFLYFYFLSYGPSTSECESPRYPFMFTYPQLVSFSLYLPSTEHRPSILAVAYLGCTSRDLLC